MEGWEVMLEPLQGLGEAEVVQVHRQVDGAAATDPALPVHIFDALDREDAVGGVPFGGVASIRLGAKGPENRFQRDEPETIGSFPPGSGAHESESEPRRDRRLTQSFILMM